MKRNFRSISTWLALFTIERIALNLPYNDKLSRLLDRLTIANEALIND